MTVSVWILSFTGAPAQSDPMQHMGAMPRTRAFHGSAVLGDYLYVLGGSTKMADGEPQLNSVAMARLKPDGTTGTWSATTPLPGPRFYISNSTIVLNDVVYVIGGSDDVDGNSLATAVYSRPLPNGTLMPWAESEPMPQAVSSITAVSTPGYLHVIGGFVRKDKASAVSKRVFSNAVFADGSMGKWQEGPPLPVALWYHHAAVAGGRVFVWGGLTTPDFRDPKPSSRMFSAPILASGLIGAWREEKAELPQPFYSASTAVAGTYLFSFCPRYEGRKLSNDIWWTTVTPDGVLPWKRRESAIPMKIYHAAATDYRRGGIYISGGRAESSSDKVADVFMFLLSSKVREQATQSWRAGEVAHSNTTLLHGRDSNIPATLTYLANQEVARTAVKGFTTVYEAQRAAGSALKSPLVLYFNLDDVGPCAEQRAKLESPEFKDVSGKATFAWVNATSYPQLTQQMGIYRVPAWVFYDTKGERKMTRTGVMSAAEIEKAVGELALN